MRGHANRSGALVLLLACLACPSAFARGKPDQLPPSTRFVLENGFEAVLIPNRTAPLVTSVVVIRAGAARERPEINGISHMLEHLLFNGTARRTQEEIYDEQDRYGIINNAHTGAEHTAFFILAAREQFPRALDLQADMLLGSTIPEEKLAKERGIIINEIAKDRVRGETLMSELFSARMYGPGGLALPVLGTAEAIGGIGRETILDYYHAWYVPNNMTAVVMGDFETEEMASLVRRCFGSAPPGLLPSDAPGSLNAAALGLTHAIRPGDPARLVWLGAPAPGLRSASFTAAQMLASLLGEDLARAAGGRLPAGGGSILDAGVALDAHESFGSFQVRAELDTAAGWEAASAALRDEVLARLAAAAWTDADLRRLRLEERASLLRLWEKPHYFGLDRAPVIAASGWESARDSAKRMSWVEAADLRALARKIANPSSWAVFFAGPDAPADAGATAIAAPGPVETHGAPSPESQDLVRRWKPAREAGPAPPLPVLSPTAASGFETTGIRTVLPNGLLVALDSTDDSRVFAAHVLVKGRAAAEPPGKAGIADLLHRLAGAGTRAHPGPALQQALAEIGGTLKVTDDPAIPYDDIYLSPEYSYLRLEAIDEFAEEAIGLLGEILAQPEIPGSEKDRGMSSAREALLARARQARASPRDRARLLVARALWGEDHPLGAPLFGTEESIRSITHADLEAFHKTYFAPRNMIVAIGTSARADRLLPVIEAKLGRWGAVDRPPRAALVNPPSRSDLAPPRAALDTPGMDAPRRLTEALDSSQAYLAWGRLVPAAPADPARTAAVEALAAVLTRRMGDTLREKRGLSYSLGAEAVPAGGSLLFTAGMGLLPASLPDARAGLREVILSLLASPPSQEEVEDAVRSTSVRALMRGLSRINRAWARCLEELREPRPARPRSRAGERPPVRAGQVVSMAREMIEPGRLGLWAEAEVAPASREP